MQPIPVSRSATADQVAGPTDGLCTKTNNGMLPLFHRAWLLTQIQLAANTVNQP